MIRTGLVILALAQLALLGCARLPLAPAAAETVDPALFAALVAAGPWVHAVPATIAQRAVLDLRNEDHVMTIYAYQDSAGGQVVVGCSEFGATLFQLQREPCGSVVILDNVLGLPERLLIRGLWEDAVLALPPRDLVAADLRRQADGAVLLSLPHGAGRREWVYGGEPLACRVIRHTVDGRVYWQTDTIRPSPGDAPMPAGWSLRHYHDIPYTIDLKLDLLLPPDQ